MKLTKVKRTVKVPAGTVMRDNHSTYSYWLVDAAFYATLAYEAATYVEIRVDGWAYKIEDAAIKEGCVIQTNRRFDIEKVDE